MTVTLGFFDPLGVWRMLEGGKTPFLSDFMDAVDMKVPSDSIQTVKDLRLAMNRRDIVGYASYDMINNCVTPLSSFQETFTAFEESKLLVLTTEDPILHAY